MSWRSILVCWALVMLTACQAEPPTTPVATMPPLTVPPVLRVLQTPVPATLIPLSTPTPIPTLAVTPTPIPVALDKWLSYDDAGKQFTFRFPPDWGGRGYTQAITRTVRALSVDTIVLHGPQGLEGPEFVMLYNWPALDPTQPPANATAWSSVAGLAKLFLYPDCTTTFDSPAPVTLAGQQVMGVKFVAQCDRLYAGYLVGMVNRGVNYGLVVDVQAEDWDAWRSTFETMFASFTFGP